MALRGGRGAGGGGRGGQERQAYLDTHNLAFPKSSVHPPKGPPTHQGPQQQPLKGPCGRQTGKLLAWPGISRPYTSGYQLGGQLGGQGSSALGWLRIQRY